MVNKTFILLKQNTDNYLYDQIINAKLKEADLQIVSHSTLCLDEEKVIKLWPKIRYDPIIQALFVYKYSHIPLPFYEIEGVDAINKVLQIKKEIRKQYSANAIENCLHSPADENEYIYNMNVIFNTDKVTDYHDKNRELQINYDLNISKEQALNVARQISLFLSSDNIVSHPQKAYSFYICDDDDHWIGDFAYFLRIAIKRLSLWESYAYCLKLSHKSPAICIYSSNHYDELLAASKFLKENGIESFIKREF